MLVISRLEGEHLTLRLEDGRAIVVTVTRVRGDKVKLGVTAPREIAIHRDGWQPRAVPMARTREAIAS